MAAPSGNARAAWLLLALVACSTATNGSSSEMTSTAHGDSGVTGVPAGAPTNSDTPVLDAGSPSDSPAVTPPDAAASAPKAVAMDAAAMTETTGTPDASTTTAPDAQIAPKDLGGCCSTHDNAGCSNADLQVCVCEKLPSCCTDAWDSACVLIVKQKYCQPGVRDCVCGDGPKQWGQHACCDSNWSDTFCNQVAEQKCSAAPGCL